MDTNEEQAFEMVQQFYKDGIEKLAENNNIEYALGCSILMLDAIKTYIIDSDSPQMLRAYFNFVDITVHVIHNEIDVRRIPERIADELQKVIDLNQNEYNKRKASANNSAECLH